MEDYQKQANDFLANHEIEFKAIFISNREFFQDDKEKRDVYQIVLSRWTGGLPEKNKQITLEIKFGQSIANSGGQRSVKKNKVFISKPIAPTSYDVLTCITKYDPGTFENFCSEFGYNEDSRKALATYEAVKAEWKDLERFFTESELIELQEIN